MYRAKLSGSANGYRFNAGDLIQAKKGELDSCDSVVWIEEVEVEEYPIHEGAGWYVLSNGEKVRGKESALKQEKEIES